MRARIELGENVRRRAPEFQRSLRRYRLDVCDAANAVRSKNFSSRSSGLIQLLDPAFVNRKNCDCPRLWIENILVSVAITVKNAFIFYTQARPTAGENFSN